MTATPTPSTPSPSVSSHPHTLTPITPSHPHIGELRPCHHTLTPSHPHIDELRPHSLTHGALSSILLPPSFPPSLPSDPPPSLPHPPLPPSLPPSLPPTPSPLTGAVDEQNQMPYYAEPCAAMLAVTYSNGNRGLRNIVRVYVVLMHQPCQ